MRFVRVFDSAHAQIEECDEDGWTALTHAVVMGKYDAVNILIRKLHHHYILYLLYKKKLFNFISSIGTSYHQI